MQFADLPLKPSTHAALKAMGYQTPTPIQAQAIPLMLQGEDVIGKAQTGTGKTAAFGIPLVEGLVETRSGVVGLVLVPTRELASQVHDVLVELARGTELELVKVYGGTGFGPQMDALRRNAPIVLVACPGRLLDLVERKACKLDKVKMLILDEADRMLDMGFIHDMRRILALVPDDRQSALFSATIDTRIRNLAKDILRNPETVEIASETTAIDLTSQFHVRLEKSEKLATLFSVLHAEKPQKAVVFTRTKHLAKRMADRLSKAGWNSVALQGNMTQGQRDRSMQSFRDGKARILVATDVAARGLDVPDISLVINHDLPHEPEQYVHRIGRTGRNGATGRSVTFVQSDEVRNWNAIERLAGAKVPVLAIEVGDVPMGPDPVRTNGPVSAGPRPSAGQAPRRGPKQGSNGGGNHGGQSRSSSQHRPRQGGNGPRRSNNGGGSGGSSNGDRRPRAQYVQGRSGRRRRD